MHSQRKIVKQFVIILETETYLLHLFRKIAVCRHDEQFRNKRILGVYIYMYKMFVNFDSVDYVQGSFKVYKVCVTDMKPDKIFKYAL